MSDNLPLPALQQMLALQPPQAAPPDQVPMNMPNAAQQGMPASAPPPQMPSDPAATQAPPPQVNLGTQTQQGPPKQSSAPLFARALQAAFQGGGYGPSSGGGPGDQGAQPGRPVSRLDAFEGFVGEFLNSFSQGMSNSGTGPAANARGFGAAVQAPYQRELQQFGVGQQQQQVQAQIAQQQAETARTQAQTDKVPVQPYGPTGPTIYMSAQEAKGIYQSQVAGQARVEAKQAQPRYMISPFGIMDTKTSKMVNGAGTGGIQAMASVTPEMAKQYGIPDQYIGQQIKNSDLVGFMNAKSRGEVAVQGEGGPSLVDKGLAAATGGKQGVANLGLGNPGLGRPVQAGDPNNPGNTQFVTGGQAVRGAMAGPTSASVTVPAASLKYFTSGPGGQMMTNFRTATDHAQLLLQLGHALEGGDYPAINAANQAWQTATGSPAPPNFQLVREALADEVSKGFAGQPSVAGSSGMRERILKAPSAAQLDGIVKTVAGLMQSKVNELGAQHQDAMTGKPNFSGGGTTGGGPTSADMLKKYPPRVN